MKKVSIVFVTICFFVGSTPRVARADLFGGDVAVLTQILAQAIMQLQQLRQLFGTARENLELIEEINRGINDSLNILRTIDPNIDPGIYKDWTNAAEAIRRLQAIYGGVGTTPDAQAQKDTDQGVAEAITFSNSLYNYTRDFDEISEQIKSASHAVSPGGAQKLTAQTLGLVIQVLNQNLRAQAVTMKVAGLALANENKRNKDESERFLDANRALSGAMKKKKVQFVAPRF